MVGNYETQFLNILACFTQGRAFHKKRMPFFLKVIYGCKKTWYTSFLFDIGHFFNLWCLQFCARHMEEFHEYMLSSSQCTCMTIYIPNVMTWDVLTWPKIHWTNWIVGFCTLKLGVYLTTLLPMSWWLTSSLFITEAFLQGKSFNLILNHIFWKCLKFEDKHFCG
jgi:hypothetical protein